MNSTATTTTPANVPPVYPSPLAARCAAFNRANAEANRLAPLYLAALAPFVGLPVLKADGTWRQKVRDAFPAPLQPANVSPSRQFSVWTETGAGYSVCFHVKAMEASAGRSDDYQIANYAESYVYVGELRDGVLTKIGNPNGPLPTDYSPEAVAAARKLAEETRQAARDAESACQPFGLFDR